MAAAESRGLLSPPPLGVEEGRYNKTAKLGEGTYGIVYRAFDSVRGENVALKKVRPRRARASPASPPVRANARAGGPRARQIRADNGEGGIPATALREISVLKEMRHENIVA